MTDVGEQRLARIALAHLVEPGDRDLGTLVRRVGPIEALEHIASGAVTGRLANAAIQRLAAASPGHRRGPTGAPTPSAGPDPYAVARSALDRARRLGARIVTPEDVEWPRQLDDLVRISRAVPGQPIRRDTDPPQCLWVRGGWALDEVCERSVAVVGARACTSYGSHIAGELCYGLADRGWAVVSGGAFGVDAAAHLGALAAGGVTVAVLACGVDRPYPVSHTSMFERIAEEGLLVSEWPPGADPHRRRFLIRNRVIAALTRGTVIVEANLRSGSRYTLGRARDLNRAVLVVPGPITSAMSAGCHEELRVPGSRLVTGVAHVLEEVGRFGEDLAPHASGVERAHDRLTPLQAQVLDGLRPRKPRSAEEISVAAGVSDREARQVLPSLVELGYVVATADGYRLAPEHTATTVTPTDPDPAPADPDPSPLDPAPADAAEAAATGHG
jgi:DNA processing protein